MAVAARPLSDARLRDKFLAQAGPVLGDARAASVADMVMALDRVYDVGALCASMAVPPVAC